MQKSKRLDCLYSDIFFIIIIVNSCISLKIVTIVIVKLKKGISVASTFQSGNHAVGIANAICIFGAVIQYLALSSL